MKNKILLTYWFIVFLFAIFILIIALPHPNKQCFIGYAQKYCESINQSYFKLQENAFYCENNNVDYRIESRTRIYNPFYFLKNEMEDCKKPSYLSQWLPKD